MENVVPKTLAGRHSDHARRYLSARVSRRSLLHLSPPASHRSVPGMDLVLEHPHSPLGVIDIRQDLCTGCGRCAMACPTQALDFTPQQESVSITFDAALCTACGQCLPRCPEAASGAITLARRTDLGRVEQGKALIYREETARCVTCGAAIAPHKMMQRIEALLGPAFATTIPVLTHYCMACRGTLALPAQERRTYGPGGV